MKVRITPKFEKHYKRLPQNIKEKAKVKEKIFRSDSFNPQLKTHRLKGEKEKAWAFWIDYSYRIKFIFLNKEEVLFLDIGTHKIYK